MFQIGETLTALEAGKIILYPTDTVWGIGCDATNAEAVDRVLALKDRERGKGLICLVDSLEMLLTYVDFVHPRLQTLLAHHQRPLTMIYPNADGLAGGVYAADGSAALRITSDPYCKSLIGSFGRPIVSTSANKRGEPHASSFGTVSSDVITQVDHVVRYRQRERSEAEPSVIARWNDNNEIEPLRQ